MKKNREIASLEALPKEALFQIFMALDSEGLKAIAQTNKYFKTRVDAFLVSYLGEIWLLQQQFFDLRLERTDVDWVSVTGGYAVPSQKEDIMRKNGDLEKLKSQPGLISYLLKQLDKNEHLKIVKKESS